MSATPILGPLLILYAVLVMSAAAADCTYCSTLSCGCGAFPCSAYTSSSKTKYYEKGLYDGTNTGLPYVDKDLIYQVYPLCPCTYMYTDSSCTGLSSSGLYVGGQIDLRNTNAVAYKAYNNTAANISLYSISQDLIGTNTKRPYRYCKVNSTGVNSCLRTYSLSAIKSMNDAYIDNMAASLGTLYDQLRVNVVNVTGLKFINLPRDVRTSIFLMHYIYQDITKYPYVWRAFVQQNWEGLVRLLIASENSATNVATGSIYKLQRSLIEYASVQPCDTRNTTLAVIFLVDSSSTTAVNKIIAEFVTTMSGAAYTTYSIVFAVVWQTAAGAQSYGLAAMGSSLASQFAVTNSITGDLTAVLNRADTLLAAKTVYSLNFLVYVGAQITTPENVFARFIEYQRVGALLYAIKTDDVYSFANMKLFARSTDVVYGLSEVSSLVEAIDGWTNYSCNGPIFLNKTYTYVAATSGGKNSTVYIHYVGLSTSEAARNVTITVTPQIACSIQVRYSTRYRYPGYYLRDGRADCHNGIFQISYSYSGTPNSTAGVTYYYSISSKYNQTISISIEEGSSTLVDTCSAGCLACNLMGSDCQGCSDYYEYFRGNCTKMYVEDIVPLADRKKEVAYPMYLTVFGIIAIALVLAFLATRTKLERVKSHML